MNKDSGVVQLEIKNVGIEELPAIISSQIDQMATLEEKVKLANKKSKEAKKYISNDMSKYEEKGKGIFKHRSGNTKDIIEDTQEAVSQLSVAQQANAEALKKSFDFQKKLADASKYLFSLGCMSMAANRTVVRELELKMSGASKGKLTALAREEMCNVVRQLKEQEDIMKKQEFLSSKLKESVSRLNDKDLLDKEQTGQISILKESLTVKDLLDKEQTDQISILKESLTVKDLLDKEQSGQISSLEERLTDKDLLDKEQTEEILSLRAQLINKEIIDEEQTERLKKLKELLVKKDDVDKKQEEDIKSNKQAIKLLSDFMIEKNLIDEAQQKEIQSLHTKIHSKRRTIIPIFISSLSLLLSILALLIIL